MHAADSPRSLRMRAPEDPLQQLVDDSLAAGRSVAAALRSLAARIEGSVPGCFATFQVQSSGGAVTRSYHSSADARELFRSWRAGRGLDTAAACPVRLEELREPRWEALRARARRAGVAMLDAAEVGPVAGGGRAEVLVFAQPRAAAAAAGLAARLAALAARLLEHERHRPAATPPAAAVQRGLFDARSEPGFKPMTRRSLASSAPPPPRFAASRRRALVIEDDEAIGDIVGRVAAREGFDVTLETDPAAALRRIEENPSACELLLVDLTLPGFDGGELARRAQRLGVTARVVVVSGLGERHARSACVGADVAAFVSKPFTPAQLRDAMGRGRAEADAV